MSEEREMEKEQHTYNLAFSTLIMRLVLGLIPIAPFSSLKTVSSGVKGCPSPCRDGNNVRTEASAAEELVYFGLGWKSSSSENITTVVD